MIERGGRSAEIGEALRAQARQMFHVWHRVRDGTLKRSSFRVSMSPLRRAVARLLAAGQTWGVPKTEGVCREILKLREALWTFVQVEGVEPTNNAAERAIRPGVLWRKGSAELKKLMRAVAWLAQGRERLPFLIHRTVCKIRVPNLCQMILGG